MKTIYIAIIAFFSMSISAQAQIVFNETFESLDTGTNILKLKKAKFNTWSKATWTVTEQIGKGFNKSDKFASCGEGENVNLVQYRNLVAGETYIFSVAVKMTNTGGKSWAGNYSLKVTSGAKEDTYTYGTEKIEEVKEGDWTKHIIEFTVLKGKENVCFNVYRWKSDVIMHIDNFKIEKK